MELYTCVANYATFYIVLRFIAHGRSEMTLKSDKHTNDALRYHTKIVCCSYVATHWNAKSKAWLIMTLNDYVHCILSHV